jgi:hypothetical protein
MVLVDVGWVGTKWKPTIFQRCRFAPFEANVFSLKKTLASKPPYACSYPPYTSMPLS